ncbi:Cytochrome P450 [Glarea lozoyensis ATCC 20868]|uniref:Cytochrome P450 n=1 Tax=Glarea lozoyensis (strain ATCC 20868 / MF5171) TaxID=1116229 RepID=S3E0W5_GLAL2|nr:Cytochrome P450 [Glarea lozoyensis ATCC 20868]EPE32163.1 Cytochrome P450 [Glarea lozoyensis ATCC 20868]
MFSDTHFKDLLVWPNLLVIFVLWLASLVFYRVFLHPLANFPGPKLAAVTRYYEAYFDVIQNGQYTFKIAEMHKKYGPIVRISPYELHVIDPAFFEKLYRQEGRWNKYAWSLDAFSGKGAMICSTDHDIHKTRRQPLNSFLSKAKVASQQVLIRQNVEKLCDRITLFIDSGDTIILGAATSAFARDVATEYIIGRNYNSLDLEDFNVGMTVLLQGSGRIWRITKHITWFGPTMKSMPVDWVIKVADAGMKAFFAYLKETTKDTKELLAQATSSTPDQKHQRTIVNEIMNSNLPPVEKSFDRVFDEVVTVTGAGFETIANALRLIFYHVFSNDEILRTLRVELRSATKRSSSDEIDLKTLEQLPYLTSVIMEGLRLSPAIATRSARIAPDRELIYGRWRIPAGTPVGMTTLLMHTDEKLYPDPMCFNPERWMDFDDRKKAEKTFAPFTKGTRICIGMHLAWAEIYLVLSTLVQRFDFDFKDVSGKDFECNSDQFIIGTPSNGVLNATVTSAEIS